MCLSREIVQFVENVFQRQHRAEENIVFTFKTDFSFTRSKIGRLNFKNNRKMFTF